MKQGSIIDYLREGKNYVRFFKLQFVEQGSDRVYNDYVVERFYQLMCWAYYSRLDKSFLPELRRIEARLKEYFE